MPRSRIWFSNYGRILNVQAWGWHVTTLGYGDAQAADGEHLVHAAVLRHVERFADCHRRRGLSSGPGEVEERRADDPAKVRQILMATGTPQEAGPGVPLTQPIGPQPNLPKAMALV